MQIKINLLHASMFSIIACSDTLRLKRLKVEGPTKQF